MIAALFLVAAVQLNSAGAVQSESAAPVPVRAQVVADLARAQIGEPVLLSLLVDRRADVAVEPVEFESGVLGSWMFLERLGVRSENAPNAPGRIVETTTWRAFALAGGVALPPIEVTYTADGAQQKVVATAGTVAVPSALAEGEDAARPAKGFREPVAWVDGSSRVWTAAIVALGLVALLVVLLVVRRRRRHAAPIPTLSAARELERLAQERRDDSAANRDVLYAVTRIVRSAVDAHVGEVRAARTDSEWLGLVAADARVPEGARSASQRLLERAERVKYAGDAPTRFATDEALADARAIVDALEPERRAA